jgi:hypothetical protein
MVDYRRRYRFSMLSNSVSAFPDERPALRIVDSQVHHYAGTALIDNPDMDDLAVLTGTIDDPAPSRRATRSRDPGFLRA